MKSIRHTLLLLISWLSCASCITNEVIKTSSDHETESVHSLLDTMHGTISASYFTQTFHKLIKKIAGPYDARKPRPDAATQTVQPQVLPGFELPRDAEFRNLTVTNLIAHTINTQGSGAISPNNVLYVQKGQINPVYTFSQGRNDGSTQREAMADSRLRPQP